MSQRALELVTTWVQKHVDENLHYPDVNHRARVLASACRLDLLRSGTRLYDIEAEVGDLEVMFRNLIRPRRGQIQIPSQQPLQPEPTAFEAARLRHIMSRATRVLRSIQSTGTSEEVW